MWIATRHGWDKPTQQSEVVPHNVWVLSWSAIFLAGFWALAYNGLLLWALGVIVALRRECDGGLFQCPFVGFNGCLQKLWA